MSVGNVMPVPQQQFADVNGNPYALGSLTFYAAGTTNPQDTFFNSDLAPGHENANPLTLDAAGRALVYLQAKGYRIILKDANGVTVYDQDDVYGFMPVADSALSNATCQFRLTLASGTPVTTTDVTAATLIYCAPYQGNKITLYDGSAWNTRTSAQFLIAVPATTNQMYDVFCYDNSGTPTLELTAWTNDTTRATALTTQDGIYVKTGATTRRYLGSVRTTGVSGQSEDSATKHFLWNYYNRVPRQLFRTESTASWTYTTATWRQANGASANKVEMIIGVAETFLDLSLLVAVVNSAGANVSAGIGEDSTSAVATAGGLSVFNTFVSGQAWTTGALLRKYPTIGYHFYAWLEISAASGTTTWYSAQATFTGNQSGLIGSILG